jgi:hypothetical protein
VASELPPEPQPSAPAFDAALHAPRDGEAAGDAAERLRAALNLLARARLSHEPVRLPVRPPRER